MEGLETRGRMQDQRWRTQRWRGAEKPTPSWGRGEPRHRIILAGRSATCRARIRPPPPRRTGAVGSPTACYNLRSPSTQRQGPRRPRADRRHSSMKRGFYTIMSAQFFSSLADNALFVAAVELLRGAGGAEWQRAALVPMFALFYVVLA